jgi:APA family basic amino acid/polyamine antiporter
LFFSKFGNVGSTGIPTFGTIITGVFAGVLAAVLDLNSLADMISIGTLMAFTVVCGGVILLRHRDEAETEPGTEFIMRLLISPTRLLTYLHG